MRLHVVEFGLIQNPLGFNQVEERHLPLPIEELGDGYRLASFGQDVFLKPPCLPLGSAVGGDGVGGCFREAEFDVAEVGAGRSDVSPGAADVALVAVKQWHFHHQLNKPLIVWRQIDLPLIAAEQRDVGNRLHHGPFRGPLRLSDFCSGCTRQRIVADHGFLECLQFKVWERHEEVAVNLIDVGPWEADGGGESPPSGIYIHRGIAEADFGTIALDAPEEHVGS